MNRWILGALVYGVLALAAIASQAREIPTESCMQKTIRMNPLEFGRKVLACELEGEVNAACCEEILSLFGAGGDVESCLCDTEYYSRILASLPSEEGVTVASFHQDLMECGVKFKGSGACNGNNHGNPKVMASAAMGFLHVALRGPFRQNEDSGISNSTDDGRQKTSPTLEAYPSLVAPSPQQTPASSPNSTSPTAPVVNEDTATLTPSPLPPATGAEDGRTESPAALQMSSPSHHPPVTVNVNVHFHLPGNQTHGPTVSSVKAVVPSPSPPLPMSGNASDDEVDGLTDSITEVTPAPPPSPGLSTASGNDTNGGSDPVAEGSMSLPSPSPEPMNISDDGETGGTDFFTEVVTTTPLEPINASDSGMDAGADSSSGAMISSPPPTQASANASDDVENGEADFFSEVVTTPPSPSVPPPVPTNSSDNGMDAGAEPSAGAMVPLPPSPVAALNASDNGENGAAEFFTEVIMPPPSPSPPPAVALDAPDSGMDAGANSSAGAIMPSPPPGMAPVNVSDGGENGVTDFFSGVVTPPASPSRPAPGPTNASGIEPSNNDTMPSPGAEKGQNNSIQEETDSSTEVTTQSPPLLPVPTNVSENATGPAVPDAASVDGPQEGAESSTEVVIPSPSPSPAGPVNVTVNVFVTLPKNLTAEGTDIATAVVTPSPLTSPITEGVPSGDGTG